MILLDEEYWQGWMNKPSEGLSVFCCAFFFHAADVDGGDAESGLRAALFLRPRSQALHWRRPEAAAEDTFAPSRTAQHLQRESAPELRFFFSSYPFLFLFNPFVVINFYVEQCFC